MIIPKSISNNAVYEYIVVIHILKPASTSLMALPFPPLETPWGIPLGLDGLLRSTTYPLADHTLGS